VKGPDAEEEKHETSAEKKKSVATADGMFADLMYR